jgi:glycosyltransferase involved in cell wall biosynthesis
MSGLRFCVALCTYQGQAFLPEQLASIARQTRLPDRMVIVDDASTDGTVDVARRFAAAAPFPVALCRNPRNLGYAQNFERAIRQAEGDVIVLSDQDDVWREDKLERMEAEFLRSPAVGLVFSDAEVVDAGLAPLGFRLWDSVGFRPELRARFAAGHAFEVLVRGNFVTGATLALRASLRDAVLPVADGTHHDAWIAILAAALAEVVPISEPLIRYRQHGGNQIGAHRVTLLGRLRRARRLRFNDMERLRVQHQAVLRRLTELGADTPARTAALEDAIRHLGVRTGLSDRRARRLAPIAGEVLSGAYTRHARGLSSALRDLLL